MKDFKKDMSRFFDSLSVSAEQYREEFNGGIYECYEDVPHEYRSRFEKNRLGARVGDFRGMLERGKEWIIEPLKSLQPHSYAAFQETVGSLLLGIVLIDDLLRPGTPPHVKLVLFFDASGRMVQVHPTLPGSTFESGRFIEPLLSLPSELSRSWLWRTGGWRVPSEAFQGPMVSRRLIRHPSSNWEPVEAVLQSFDPRNWKKLMAEVLNRFPDTVVTHYNPHDGRPHQWTSMRCFLDTRPADLSGPVGDQFFVFDEKRDQTVYHIHQGDIDDIRILRDPSNAIDRYCAHVLRGSPGEFDFSPWSDPLVD